MSENALQIIGLLLLILTNGLFSMTEMAVVSARKARLQSILEAGDRRAGKVLELLEDPNNFFSTIQIAISLIGVVTGALGAQTFAGDLAAVLEKVSFLKGAAYSLSVFLISVVITYFTLVLGELIPKRIATSDPERIAMVMCSPIGFLSKIFKPIIAVLSGSTNLGLKLLNIRESEDAGVSEEEVKVMIEQGKQTGVFEENEQDIVESVFRMSDRSVESLMTPRVELEWIDLEAPLEESLQEIRNSAYHYFPLVRGNPDDVIGVLSSKNLLDAYIDGKPIDLEAIAETPLYVPESKPALSLLDDLKESDKNFAIVLDEYGGFSGMITPYELLNEIVGDDVTTIGDDDPEDDVMIRPDGSWSFDGQTDIEEFKKTLELRDLPEEQRIGYQTLAGFILSQMGRIPRTGDCFDWDKYHFEIVDMDGRRIDRVFVSILPQQEQL